MVLTRPLRLGIVGCGFAAREVHLPRLGRLTGDFRVTAVCDRDVSAARSVAARLDDPVIHEDVDRLVHEVDLDAVAVLTPLKGEIVLKVLEAGLDVFVEKPLAENIEAATAIAETGARLGRVVLVGTMREHERAIDHVRSALLEIGPVLHASLIDVCSGGSVAPVVEHLTDPVLQSTFPSALSSRHRNALQTAMLEMVHDVSLLRSIFGPGIELRESATSDDGWILWGSLLLPGGIPCTFTVCEYGLVGQAVFHQRLMFIGRQGIVTLTLSDPNLPDASCLVEVTKEEPIAIFTDSYEEQWRYFARCVATRAVEKGNAQVAVEDLRLLWEIVHEGCAPC